MSEFLAEAQVLIRPDTTGFRLLLETQVATAIATARIPPVTVPVITTPGAAAGLQGIARSSQELAGADTVRAAAAKAAAQSERELAAATKHRAAQQAFAQRGAFATALSLGGVRGATLAANSAFLVGAAGAVAFFKSLQLAVNLEQELKVFEVTAGATADEMDRVAKSARDLGRDVALPAVSAGDAAQAMTELAKAGLEVEDAIDGARGVLELATAAQISNADSANLVANALNAFGLAGDQAHRVANLLAVASSEAQGSISDMGLSLQQAAAIARQVGLSLEDTVALLTLLRKNGVAASDAGTALRTSFIRLIAPGKEAKAIIDDLGISLRNSQGQFRADVFAQFENATRNLTKARRDEISVILFGQDAIRAQGILRREGVEGLEQQRRAQEDTNKVQELAAARTTGLGGAVENLKNQTADTGLGIGNFVKGPLTFLVTGLADTVGFVNTAARAVSDFNDAVNFTSDLDRFDKAVTDAGASVGTYLDEVTEGIPVLDGFFETIDKGNEDLEEQVSVFDRLTKSVTGTINALKGAITTSAETTEKSIPTVTNTIARDIAIAQAGGQQDRELDLLRQREKNQAAFLEKILKRPETEANVKLAEEAALNLDNTRARIQTILDQRVATLDRQASDAETAARAIAAKALEADQAIAGALLGGRGRLENLISRAAGTDPLQDDIRFTQALVNLINDQIAEARKRIKDVTVRKQFIEASNKLLIQLLLDIKQDKEQAAKDARAALVTQQANIVEGVQLDVELADTNEASANRRIAIRLKLIAALKKEARLLKLQGNALKENRNQIARINAEIRAIKEEEKKTEEEVKGGGFSPFEFMQTLQGFSANLLGNLIPGFATAGLVGGQDNVVSPTAKLQASAGANRVSGPTFGQAATEVDILKEMLRVLRAIQSGRAHPEAGFERVLSSAVMDGQGGGGGGGQSVN